MKILNSNPLTVRKYLTINHLINDICDKYKHQTVFCFKKNATYQSITYSTLYSDILQVSKYLKTIGFHKNDKMVIYSPNCYEMLVTELAVMYSGGIAVPIFAYFKKETANYLISFCDANYLSIYGEFQFSQLSEDLNIKQCIIFDNTFYPKTKQSFNIIHLSKILSQSYDDRLITDESCNENDICLNMYTSGTMGTPKCVQLTHKNILSQQDALSQLWNVNSSDRFLSYLPWHHSFGGIFEIFSVLYNGASYWLESSYGKDIQSIIDNWKIVKPTVFFSVPKIHKSLVEHLYIDKSFEKELFHPEFKFIFTAAAPLPINVANEYIQRKIKILEGWGLTETSPCCTISEFDGKKEIGTVGFPIPGVTLAIDEDGEILVKGDNVMKGYYKNESANKDVFTADGWFRTGDVGEITPDGLKIISRKDRIFKLSNGEKVIPSDIEKLLEKKCHYVACSIVYGSGKEYPIALIFPNSKFFQNPIYDKTPEDGCFCPRNINELGRCLSGCLNDVNCDIHQKFSKIKIAAIINKELSIDDNTLTPSLKPSPKNIIQKYFDLISKLYSNKVPDDKDIYVIILDPLIKNAINYGGN
ncbi:MAG TPA: AMP-binding protein [Bacteroidia bacterium]|nr:AMP-binding protein [Bacteroidia bacterium]